MIFKLFERMRKNFWITQINEAELIIYEACCPLDYSIETSINVTGMLNDFPAQCDFESTEMELNVDSARRISA
jgi:hypothetical protein